jgi:hypothetical protein
MIESTLRKKLKIDDILELEAQLVEPVSLTFHSALRTFST